MSGRVFVGGIVTPLSIAETKIIENGILGVDAQGIIQFVDDLDASPVTTEGVTTQDNKSKAASFLDGKGWDKSSEVIYLAEGSFLCPGFIDTHTVCIDAMCGC